MFLLQFIFIAEKSKLKQLSHDVFFGMIDCCFLILFRPYEYPPFEWPNILCTCASWFLDIWRKLRHLGMTVITVNCSFWNLLLESLREILNKYRVHIQATNVLIYKLPWLHNLLHKDIISPCLLILFILPKPLNNPFLIKPQSRSLHNNILIILYPLSLGQSIARLIFYGFPPRVLLNLR